MSSKGSERVVFFVGAIIGADIDKVPVSVTIGTGEKYLRYEVADGVLVGAPCGCPACTDRIQPGHFACQSVPPDLVAAEEKGEIDRYYSDGRWVWQVS